MTVEVTCVAPNQQNSEFEGYIRVENQDNPEDFDLIPVYLKTPKNIHTINTMILQLIFKLKNSYLEKIGVYFKHLI